jgi:hypothetical protein
MGDGGFNDRYWTLEQALGWMLTRDREFVDQNSGEALTALSLQARGADGRHRCLRTPLTKFLIESPEVQPAYDRCVRELHRTLKEGKLHALGELKSIKRRVEINPRHWIDYTIAPGPDGLLADRRFDEPSSSESGCFRRIRLLKFSILRIWRAKMQGGTHEPPARKQTSATIKRAEKLIEEIMEAHRDCPLTKEQLLKTVMEQIPDVKPSAILQIRSRIIKDRKMGRWSQAGRPRKNRSCKIEKR